MYIVQADARDIVCEYVVMRKVGFPRECELEVGSFIRSRSRTWSASFQLAALLPQHAA
jgi:hypothetical protein